MNFVQHTKCVTIKNKVYPSWAPAPTTTLILLSIPVLLASLAIPYIALVEIPLLIAYCEWWLYDRLICLGGEASAIGLLGKPEPPDKKTGFDKLDTDFSINLVLAPHNIQELPAGYPGNVPPPPAGSDAKAYYHEKFLEALHHAIADDPIQGNLIREQATTHDAGWDFLGYFNTVGGSMTISHHQAYLHCEFEGGGIYKFLQMLKTLLVIATAAAVICSIPVFGWIACAIGAAVAAIIAVAGLVAALNDTGSPTVVNPTTGATTDQLHPMQDILFVKGDWVFDTRTTAGTRSIRSSCACWPARPATRPTTKSIGSMRSDRSWWPGRSGGSTILIRRTRPTTRTPVRPRLRTGRTGSSPSAMPPEKPRPA